MPPTFVILSTCKEDRYRNNLLALLSLPEGTHVQYRYSWELVRCDSPSDEFPGEGTLFPTPAKHGDRIVGAPVLLGYLVDQDPVQVVPVRFGRLANYTWAGSHVMLQLALKEFAYASDLDAFTASLKKSFSIPDKAGFGPEDVRLVARIPALARVERTTAKTHWEKIATQISGTPRFHNVGVYSMVSEFIDERSRWSVPWIASPRQPAQRLLKPDTNGRYRLAPGRFHEVRVYHFTPRCDAAANGRLLFETQEPPLRMLSASSQPIDSPYDVKRFRFRTPLLHQTDYARITITQAVTSPPADPTSVAHSRIDHRPEEGVESSDAKYRAEFAAERRVSVDLDLVLRAATWWVLIRGALTGVLFSLPAMTAVMVANRATISVTAATTIAVVGAIAGALASFGLKKPY
jgi:hypothetical protein